MNFKWKQIKPRDIGPIKQFPWITVIMSQNFGVKSNAEKESTDNETPPELG